MGDGSTTEFAFNFPYFENTNIIVTKNNTTAAGYSIVGTSAAPDADIPYTGGKVVFESAPTSLDSITIARSLPLSRIVDYQPTAKIVPTTLNQDMNYMMEVLKDQQDEFDTLCSQYHDIADKESTTTLLAKITEIGQQITTIGQRITDSNQQITDFYTALVNGRVMSKDDFYSHTTNCLTSVPQDIKLELSSGTLTLKSGSKIYLANGTLSDTVTITSDISATQNNNGKYMIIRSGGSALYLASLDGCLSGTIATRPASIDTASGLYFATDENKMYLTGDSGANWYSSTDYSLPLAIITVSNGAISSIDQIFNGFGYIGSTVFVLPGVKGLIPNGRNADGTLKNTAITTNSVQTLTNASNLTTDLWYVIKTDGSIENSLTNYWTYDAQRNLWVHNDSIFNICIFAKSSATAGIISDFVLRSVIQISDYVNITQ